MAVSYTHLDIIAYRESHGGFQSVDDLKNVSGIGDKTLDKIRESLYAVSYTHLHIKTTS